MKRKALGLAAVVCAAVFGTAAPALADPGNTATNSVGTVQAGAVSASPTASVASPTAAATVAAPAGTVACIEVVVAASTVPRIEVLLAPANVTVFRPSRLSKPVPVIVMLSPTDTVDGVMLEIVTPVADIETTYWVKWVTSADAVRPDWSTVATNSVG